MNKNTLTSESERLYLRAMTTTRIIASARRRRFTAARAFDLF
jgi:hypothetical protein